MQILKFIIGIQDTYTIQLVWTYNPKFIPGFHPKMHLALEQRIFIVDSFGTHKPEVITLQSFQREFRIIIARPTVGRVFKMERKWAVSNLNKSNCGDCKRTGKSTENIDAVRLNIVMHGLEYLY